MKKRRIRTFLRDVRSSFNPHHYDAFSLRDSMKKTGAYFFGVLILSFIIMGVLTIPFLVTLPQYLESQFEKFEMLQLTANVSMNEPVLIAKQGPSFILDTTGSTTGLTADEKVVVTKDTIYYKPFFTTYQLDTKEFGNLSGDRTLAIKILTAFSLLILPGIVLLMFFFFTLKYLIMIVIAGLTAFFIIDLTRTKILWDRLLIMAAHAATPMMLIEVAITPFTLRQLLLPVWSLFGVYMYVITTLLFVVLFVVSIYYAKKRRGYYHGIRL